MQVQALLQALQEAELLAVMAGMVPMALPQQMRPMQRLILRAFQLSPVLAGRAAALVERLKQEKEATAAMGALVATRS